MLSTEQEIFRRCQASLRGLKEQGKIPIRDDVPKIVERVFNQLKDDPAYPKDHFKHIIQQDIVERLQSNITTTIGNIKILEAQNTNHLKWLPNKDQTNWHFSNRYKKFLLEQPQFGEIFTNKIYEAADEILSRLEDPIRAGPWRRQGLVFGNVQSGKTTSYSALINKAVDAGYKIIIVLGGLNNNLRAQTQVALEENFIGKTTAIEDAKIEKTELGEINIGEELNVDVFTNKDEKKGDLKKSDVNRLKSISFGNNPILFVIKKNTASLSSLISIVQSKIKESEDQLDLPMLLIDDECDHGSVNTNDPDGTTSPTKLNAQIRGLMAHFSRCSYVAYTATPFANIFINPDDSNLKISVQGDYVKDENGDIIWDFAGKNKLTKKRRRETIIKHAKDNDLFPRDFVINLPISQSYLGAKKLFNIPDFVDDDFDSNPLPVIKTMEQLLNYDHEKIRLEKEWIPTPHKKDSVFEYDGDENDISPTLKYAMKCFILSIAIRNIRVGNNKHNTMLINITNYNNTQSQVIKNVKEELQYLIEGLKGNHLSLLSEFEEIWNNDFIITTKALNDMIETNELDINEPKGFSNISWKEIHNELINKVAAKKIEVHGVYGDNRDVLQYEGQYKNVGLNVIAVGAIKLSRGLVLKDLTVSYFKRPSKQYDTLLQMGRWFGYRPRYLDACRLFLDSNLLDWFEKAAVATEKLKEKFQEMIDAGKSPQDWGLAVRTFPDIKNLIPTARNKMKLSAEYNLGGLSETRPTTTAFDLSKETIDKNISTFEGLISTFKPLINKENHNVIYKDVPSSYVLEFLKKYKSSIHERNLVQGLLTEFIEESNKKESLKNWDIFIKGRKNLEEDEFLTINQQKVPIIKRSPFTGKLSLKILTEGEHYIKESNGKKMETKFNTENLLKETKKSIKETYHIGNISDPVDLQLIVDENTQKIAREIYLKKMEEHQKDPRKIIPENIIRSVMDPTKGYICFYLFNPSKHEKEELKDLYKDYNSAVIGFAVHLPKVSINKSARINKKMQEELGLLDNDDSYYSEEEDD